MTANPSGAPSAAPDPGVSSAERVDHLAEFGAPRLWAALIGIIAVVIAFIAWATIARAPDTVALSGVVTTEGGVVEVIPSRSGTVTGVYVSVGEQVVAGNNIAELEDDAGARYRVQAPADGTVIELTAQVGAFADAGRPLAILQESGQNLLAIALVPVASLGDLSIGQPALISPATQPASQYGYARGVVSSIASIPMSQARIDQLTGDLSGFAALQAPDTPVVEVHVALTPDPSTASGLSWTQGQGPAIPLIGGTPWTGEAITGESAPISKLLG